jgi:hypothetical protein
MLNYVSIVAIDSHSEEISIAGISEESEVFRSSDTYLPNVTQLEIVNNTLIQTILSHCPCCIKTV